MPRALTSCVIATEIATEHRLSPREHDIVSRTAKGHSGKRIAYELGLAPSTVAGHLASAAAKLGVKSRVELITVFLAGSSGKKVHDPP